MKASDPREALPEHLPALRAFAISLSGNVATADDLVQDTIVKAWTNIEKFKPGTNLRAWLFTILRNTYFSDRRKRKREVSDPDGIHAAKIAVKPDHDGRLAFNDDVAEMTGVAVGTVKSRANRARARLAELLGLEAGENPLPDTHGPDLAAMSTPKAKAV